MRLTFFGVKREREIATRVSLFAWQSAAVGFNVPSHQIVSSVWGLAHLRYLRLQMCHEAQHIQTYRKDPTVVLNLANSGPMTE